MVSRVAHQHFARKNIYDGINNAIGDGRLSDNILCQDYGNCPVSTLTKKQSQRGTSQFGGHTWVNMDVF